MNVETEWRPSAGTKTGMVWDLADALFRQTGRVPSAGEVVEAYLRLDPGHNRNTAQTQYSQWKKAHLNRPAQLETPGSASPRFRLMIGANGQITLPPAALSVLKLQPGQDVVATLSGGELRLASAATALARARDAVRQFDTGQGSSVEELIVSRRREAEAE